MIRAWYAEESRLRRRLSARCSDDSVEELVLGRVGAKPIQSRSGHVRKRASRDKEKRWKRKRLYRARNKGGDDVINGQMRL